MLIKNTDAGRVLTQNKREIDEEDSICSRYIYTYLEIPERKES
jgi:hypothetical protein